MATADAAAILSLVVDGVALAWTAGRFARTLPGVAESRFEWCVVSAILAAVELVASMQVLGTIRGLWWPAVLACHALLVVVAVVMIRRPPPVAPWAATWSGRHVAIAALVGAASGVSVALALGGAPSEADTLRYHAINVAQWLTHHEIWTLAYSAPGDATSAYPGNGDLVSLWLAMPTHTMRVADLGDVGAQLLAVALIALLVRDLGGSLGAGTLMGLVVLWAPPVYTTAEQSMTTDLFALCFLLMGAHALLRGREHDGVAWWVVFGACTGVAAGSKYVTLIPVACLLAISVPFLWRRWTAWILVAVPFLVLSGIWFVRNAVMTGNPVYPLNVSVAGHVILAGNYTLYAPYSGSTLGRLISGDFRGAGLAVAAAVVYLGPVAMIMVSALTRRAWSEHRMVAGLAVMWLVAYAMTPTTASVDVAQVAGALRYSLPALALAAVLTPRVLSKRLVGVLIILAAVVDIAYIVSFPTTALHPGVVEALSAAVGSGVAATLLLTAARPVLARPRWQGKASRAGAAVVGTVVVGIGTVVAGAGNPHSALVDATIAAHPGPVVVVDDYTVLPLLGADLSNSLAGVGHGEQGRLLPITEIAAFNAQLLALHPSLVAVGTVWVPFRAAPPDWTPPSWLHYIGTDAGARLYVPG